MNVLLVSQCDKRALKETRRVIDQFAERRGSRTWQTAITQAGLDTLRAMLRRTARKNTAVACHWIRGIDQTELVWIVGDARRFNAVGTTPTNTTSRDILRSRDEHPWIHAETIKLLAVMAALFHDFGKASDGFQEKLRAARPLADPYRHEWLSLKLFQAFVSGREDRAWLEELADVTRPLVACSDETQRLDTPDGFRGLGPIAQAVGWLVLSHHRLPSTDASSAALKYLPQAIERSWSYPRLDATDAEKRKFLAFDQGLPFASVDWRRRAAKAAAEVLGCTNLHAPDSAPLHDPYSMAMARLSLIVADHHYSSLPTHPKYGDAGFPLFANTDAKTGQCKQRLDEHLIGVASHSRRVARALLHLDRDLPRIARHRGFKRRSAGERFRWQDKAFDLALSLASASHARGFFGVNMASTGCGKTLANGRILYGLADPSRGTRFTIALGLRTLTLQTGDAYRSRLSLGEEDLAVLIGSSAVRDLHEAAKSSGVEQAVPAPRVPGSESAESLMEDNAYVHFAGSLEDGPLARWLGGDPRMMNLLQAPILACTIDHLMPACEATRGGRHVGPLLRLMTSDLVLDEPDDFDLTDLPALSRLVFTAGMVGSRVLLSSATLAPSLVSGLFKAYARGRAHFQHHQRSDERDARIPCAWFDELGVAHVDATADTFDASHDAFAKRRAIKLSALPQRRHMDVLPFPILAGAKGKRTDRIRASAALTAALPEAIRRLHEDNHLIGEGGKRVSFGLVRIANIDPLIDVAVGLRGTERLPDGWHLRVLVYHSRLPLLMRSATERLLDAVLQRQDPRKALAHPAVRKACAETDGTDVVFLVMASPVAEVGRDHDYDWAIVEPSSMRSIIQLVGRIRRHRPEPYARTNVLVLERNLRAAARYKPAYVWPGYESDTAPFARTSILDLLRTDERARLDSTARILEHVPLSPREHLADLEHQRTAQVFEPRGRDRQWDASLAWTSSAHLVGLVQHHPRFRESRRQETFAWRFSGDTETTGFFKREQGRSGRWDISWSRQDELVSTMEVLDAPQVATWGPDSYVTELDDTARLLGQGDVARIADRFGTVELDEEDIQHGWLYHDTLGFRRRTGTGGTP